ncbi:DUF5679 domain-containing protein [Dictyobacter formicarum]|uniref:DUF5679 domain-containing protein n=1 Tax=Dictyobacter formicarum TaxID=2778368 RepID=A0ABQ3VT31_9CHLR|nr:DUF5679 domain-containing protein [Dictyobacter formicarum]GHO88896.1 hypothetical protein KSZ_69020 [Dictyobacter formicarum]
MQRIRKYSSVIVKIILDTIGGLIMLGRCIVQRISSRIQTTQLSAASLRTPEELPGAVVKSNITGAEIDRGLNSSPELTVTAVEKPGAAELTTASEEPIFETVSPVMIDDSSVIEEAVVTEEIPLAQQIPVPEETSIVTETPVAEESAAELTREDETIASAQNEAEKIPVEPAITQPEAYCVKCRTRRGMKDAKRIVTKNNRNAMEGTCPVCGTRLFRFITTK